MIPDETPIYRDDTLRA